MPDYLAAFRKRYVLKHAGRRHHAHGDEKQRRITFAWAARRAREGPTAAVFEFDQDTGAATGSPAQGTTRTTARTDNNWKNIDDSTTAYSASPIQAGSNSFTVYQFGKFTGTFNQVLAGLWAHTAGAFGAGLTLKSIVTSTYATPATAANAALTVDSTAAIAIGSGQTVLFSTVGPQGTSPTATLSAAGYSQYIATQLQTTVSAAPGDTTTVTLTLSYNEN